MTPRQAHAMHRRQMRAHGETVTLRRLTPLTDVTVRARVTDYAPEELTAGIKQGARKVIILAKDLSATAFPVPPKQNDKVIARGKTLNIETVDDSTRRVAGELIAYEIEASGG